MNVKALAKTISFVSNPVRSIHVAGNDDWAKFVLTKPSAVTLGTSQNTAGRFALQKCTSTGAIRTAAGSTSATTEVGPKSSARVTNFWPRGTYYVQIREQGNDGVIDTYRLAFDTVAIPPPPAPSNLEALESGSE